MKKFEILTTLTDYTCELFENGNTMKASTEVRPKTAIAIPVSYDETTGKYCIKEENVLDFIKSTTVQTIDKRTTFARIELKNGFVIYETSSAVSEEGYDEEIGKKICINKAKDKIYELLGFVLKCVQ